MIPTLFDFESDTTTWWILLGLIGQGLFTMRFFVQWMASKKAQKSVIPLSFWYYSIIGTGILLAYAIYRQDPVFILVQLMGFFIYVRNIYYIARGPNSVKSD